MVERELLADAEAADGVAGALARLGCVDEAQLAAAIRAGELDGAEHATRVALLTGSQGAKARRAALEESPPRATPVRAVAGQPPPVRGVEAPTQKLRVPGRGATGALAGGPGYASRDPISPPLSPVMSAVDQLWLRCAVIIAIAMGVAMVAIGVATYLMAVDDNAAAWVLYVLAGIVTVAMPAIPWFYLRELRAMLEPSGA